MSMSLEEKRNTVCRTTADLISRATPESIGAALLLCPTGMIEKAIQIADTKNGIKLIRFGPVKAYQVKSNSGHDSYVVLPAKFCSCIYYKENVIKSPLFVAWTCKHDLAVQLRLGIGDPIVEESTNGVQLILNELTL
jgi:hypothetical protein